VVGKRAGSGATGEEGLGPFALPADHDGGVDADEEEERALQVDVDGALARNVGGQPPLVPLAGHKVEQRFRRVEAKLFFMLGRGVAQGAAPQVDLREVFFLDKVVGDGGFPRAAACAW
jgi:hypothetical protein